MRRNMCQPYQRTVQHATLEVKRTLTDVRGATLAQDSETYTVHELAGFAATSMPTSGRMSIMRCIRDGPIVSFGARPVAIGW